MKKYLMAGLVLAALALTGCASSIEQTAEDAARAQQERSDRLQRDHRSATDRLDQQVN
ncbi:hypothetical protein [Marinospirillum perlucidum]|uniref:hypothetical protein n=1 Tax=Marinospirillum perlucidum TaxID=1982602 RepID=UPI001390178A|nr:hypothetical protein [Marinospirillum perlucidum]